MPQRGFFKPEKITPQPTCTQVLSRQRKPREMDSENSFTMVRSTACCILFVFSAINPYILLRLALSNVVPSDDTPAHEYMVHITPRIDY